MEVLRLGNFTSLDFDICLHSFRADSSSLQISAILVGHFTRRNVCIRDSLQNFQNNCAEKNILAREIPCTAPLFDLPRPGDTR